MINKILERLVKIDETMSNTRLNKRLISSGAMKIVYGMFIIAGLMTTLGSLYILYITLHTYY